LSDILEGHEIWAKGAVVFDLVDADRVEAKVAAPNTATRSTLLALEDGKLRWGCTCTSDPKAYCKHLVATALEVQRQSHNNIYKSVGIIIQNRKMLIARPFGRQAFAAPGARIAEDETATQTLKRELAKEFGITVNERDLGPFGTFSVGAANHPDQQVHTEVFMVYDWQGDIQPCSDIDEIIWLASDARHDVQIGSVFSQEVLPRLRELELVD
jgi:8-oxo-dGTP diphosphatase